MSLYNKVDKDQAQGRRGGIKPRERKFSGRFEAILLLISKHHENLLQITASQLFKQQARKSFSWYGFNLVFEFLNVLHIYVK